MFILVCATMGAASEGCWNHGGTELRYNGRKPLWKTKRSGGKKDPAGNLQGTGDEDKK